MGSFKVTPRIVISLVSFILVLAVGFGGHERGFLRDLTDLFLAEAEPVLVTSPSPSISPDVLGTQFDTTQFYPVAKVTDGDTIKVTLNGKTETVRVVGINTPETVDPRRPPECFGHQASQKMKDLVEGKLVRLESDATQSDRDRYQRLLRFVFLPDGTDVGLQLIKEGFAHESLYSSVPHKYHPAYVAAQLEAETALRGLWNPQVCSN